MYSFCLYTHHSAIPYSVPSHLRICCGNSDKVGSPKRGSALSVVIKSKVGERLYCTEIHLQTDQSSLLALYTSPVHQCARHCLRLESTHVPPLDCIYVVVAVVESPGSH